MRPKTAAGTPPPTAHTVDIRIALPRAWWDELDTIATERAITKSDLVRLVLHDFLRDRRRDPDR